MASGACCSCSATGHSAAPLLLPANDASVVSAVTKRQGTWRRGCWTEQPVKQAQGMLRNSLAKRVGGRRAAGASSRRFVRARAMVIASHHANVACGATRLPWLPVRFSSSPRARWNRLEQAEQAAPPAARRGAERGGGIASARAAATCCQRASLRQ